MKPRSRPRLHDEYVIALDVAVVALHWLAVSWGTFYPGVSAHLRRMADHFAVKLKKARDEYEMPTQVVTLRYGVDKDKPPRP
jgi:predicted GIY-YIG superfamily endonuclease